MRLKTIIAAILFLALGTFASKAQDADYSFRTRFDSAKQLYLQGMYASAESEFDRLADDVTDKHTLFYSEILANKIMCAIALGRANVEGLVYDFETRFPNDPQLAMVKFHMASYQFDQAEYEKARASFAGINEKNLYRTVKDEYAFKYAYCNMRVGNMKDALTGFSKVMDSELNQYTYPATYYTAYIHYLDKDFEQAFNYFVKARRDSRFTDLSDYYATESKFMLKDWDYAIENGEAVYGKLTPDLQGNLARIISESYFAKNNNAKAKEYLDKYIASGVTITRKDRYYAGVVSYSLQQYREAIENFSSVLGAEDTIGQSAYYYSANSYLQVKNKLSALDCFKKASECDFDQTVKEDAMFNFAKLSFDVNKDISQFEKYVASYPNSGKDDVINTYMSVAFLQDNDFTSAIEVMEKIKNPTWDVRSNLQKAQLYKALQLVSGGGYKSAMELLHDAVDNGSDPAVTRLANYYLTQCNYAVGNYVDAIGIGRILASDPVFRTYDEYDMLQLILGYSYFNSRNFDTAQPYFISFLETDAAKGNLQRDATVRLADTYLMQNDYTKASAEYAKVYNRYSDNDIYANYQGALVYGLMDEYAKKIDLLSDAVAKHPGAKLYPEAMYELGRTYVQRNNPDEATKCFEALLSARDSSFYSRSLLELAMISSNKGERQKAIDYYKRIVSDTPNSAEVQDALAGMESLYQLSGRPQEYLAYLDGLGMSNIKTVSEKEQMIFNAAEQVYLSGNHSSAIRSLQSFLNQYPNGARAAQAWFYLAESYKASGRNESAADAYLECMSKEKGDYSEAATRNYADICYNLGNYKKALEAYETLQAIATNDVIRTAGKVGEMLSNYNSRQYYKSLNNALALAGDTSLDDETRRKAEFIAAKSYIVLGDRTSAKALLTKLSADCSDAVGAECAYIMIQDYYNAGDFEQVEKKVYEFSDSKTPQLYWLAKSFIILGDSFADRERWEQARATYESIAKSYKVSVANDDVLEQTEMRLNKLKAMGR